MLSLSLMWIPIGVPAIDDAAGPRVEAASEADGLPERQDLPGGAAGDQDHDREDGRRHRRTTRPPRAEVTHSASEPKATSTPRLAGA